MNFAALEPQLLALGDALRARGWRIASAESCTVTSSLLIAPASLKAAVTNAEDCVAPWDEITS